MGSTELRALLLIGLMASPAARADCPVGKKTLIDNGQTGYAETGDSWNTWPSNQQSIGPDYRYLSKYVGAPGAKGKATWTPKLPAAGLYKVEATFRATENRTSDADYFVHAGDGKVTHKVVDQRDGTDKGQPSHGPVYADLGTHWFAPGKGHVVLDGTDDSQSDEADAVQWTLVSCTDGGEPEPPKGCSAKSPVVGYAVSVGAATGWESEGNAQGAPDDVFALNPNLESGETLQATGFDTCDPDGSETITSVTVGVRTKVQYASGKYAVVLKLASAGVTKTFAHEALAWDEVDVTATKAAWTWADVKGLSAKLSLHDHPGGYIDSDVWVDAFRVTVAFTGCAPQAAKACMDGQIRWIDSCGAVGGVADGCDDGDPCTGDGCLGESCTHVPAGTSDCGPGCTPRATKGCHGNAVVWLDSCGTPTEVVAPCADEDPCTEDLCDPGTGTCTHSPIPSPECSACPPGVSTRCEGGHVRWVDGCGATGAVAVDCDDGDPCTIDGCVDQLCTHTHSSDCGEAPACTQTPAVVCQGGALVSLDACGKVVGVSKACDDGDPCTLDACVEGAPESCAHAPLEPEHCASGGTLGEPASLGGAGSGGADAAGGFSSALDAGHQEVQTRTWTEGCGSGRGGGPVSLSVLLLGLWLTRRRRPASA